MKITKITKITNNNGLGRKFPEIPPGEFFGKGIKERILYFLWKNYPNSFSYQQIADNLKIEKSKIVSIMNRDLESNRSNNFLINTHKEGPIKLWTLSPIALSSLNKKAELYKKFIYQEEEKEKRILEEVKSKEDMVIACNDLLKKVDFERDRNIIIVDFMNIASWNPALSEKIIQDPSFFFETFEEVHSSTNLKIKLINLPKDITYSIEKLRISHTEQLIVLEGRVVSLSQVTPTIDSITYECPTCGSLLTTRVDKKLINPEVPYPKKCSCGRKKDFVLVSKHEKNYVRVLLEDLQDKTDNPYTQRILANVEGDLLSNENIKIFTPGNEVRLVGVLHTKLKLINGKVSKYAQFEFEVFSADLLDKEIDISSFSQEDIHKIKKLSHEIDSKGFSVIVPSFAPEVYGYEFVKQALILQLCAQKNVHEKGKVKRNKPNILLIGDPGIAKSLLGNFVIKVSPGSKKAVGGGSSAVGITASVIKEEESFGGYRVEPGSLILAKDILFIDELNNLSDEDKPKLQEGLSEASVTINKASLHVKLKVVAGVLACANPKKGHFDLNQDYISQFNIPSPIINRFDIIFILTDSVDKSRDESIVERMVDREMNKINPTYKIDFLKKFFTYIRLQPEPAIESKIKQKLKSIYSKARKYKTDSIMINPRFMESLIRMIKASAKLRMSKKVSIKDIKRVLEILNHSHYQKDQYTKFLIDEE